MRRLLPSLLVLLLTVPAAFAGTEKKGPAVDLDVKDEDVHVILKSMQQQCGIKNLVIDKDVAGKGTFLFRAVPCPTAFDVVLKTMSLGWGEYSSDVVEVHKKR